MNSALIGFTGFVGSNLLKSRFFDLKLNRSNIHTIRQKSFNHIICCGLPAEKWKANLSPKEDLDNTLNLIDNLSKVKSEFFTLISTVDVYRTPYGCDERDFCDTPNQAYGINRLLLENFVATNFNSYQIIRLPGLFGPGLKKNIIYDFLYKNNIVNITNNNYYQWYPIAMLSDHIDFLMKNKEINVINLCTEPLSTSEVISNCFPIYSSIDLKDTSVFYDVKTLYAPLFGKKDYIFSKKEVLDLILEYIHSEEI